MKTTQPKCVNLYVRDFKTRGVVHTIPLTCPLSSRRIEQVMLGMLRNMNTDDYSIDDDEAMAEAEKAVSK